MKFRTGTPVNNGRFLCMLEPLHSPIPEPEILIWAGGYWSYRSSPEKCRREVYCWCAIPYLTIDDCVEDEYRYAIGIYPDINFGAFKNGPFKTLSEALNLDGDIGDFIYKVHTEEPSIPIRKWNEEKESWIARKKKKRRNKA